MPLAWYAWVPSDSDSRCSSCLMCRRRRAFWACRFARSVWSEAVETATVEGSDGRCWASWMAACSSGCRWMKERWTRAARARADRQPAPHAPAERRRGRRTAGGGLAAVPVLHRRGDRPGRPGVPPLRRRDRTDLRRPLNDSSRPRRRRRTRFRHMRQCPAQSSSSISWIGPHPA
jgi:hypothetical protein